MAEAVTGTKLAPSEQVIEPEKVNRGQVRSMVEGLLYTDSEGREWTVTLEAPGKVLSVPASLEKSGALLPEHEIRIVFTSGDTTVSEEYTALTPLEDLSDDELEDWLAAALKGEGL